MPIYSGGASGLFFDAEATGIAMEQVKPRVREIARNMFLIYLGLTLAGFFLLWAGPMDAFDAACHTLSSISTGGFSTRQAGPRLLRLPLQRVRDYRADVPWGNQLHAAVRSGDEGLVSHIQG